MSDAAKHAPDPQAAWLEHNLAQLRYFRALPLRSRLQAVEGMADVIRRFEQMRRQGKLKSR